MKHPVRSLKKGEFFTRKPLEEPKENQVYIRGEYDRGSSCYICTRFDDINRSICLPADKEVYTGFTF